MAEPTRPKASTAHGREITPPRHGLSGKAETADPVPDTDDRVPLEVYRFWARLIRQIYEGDLLVWANCGWTMNVIGVLDVKAVI